MSTKERVHTLVEQVPPEKLEQAERLLWDLVMTPEERSARIDALLEKRKVGTFTDTDRLELARLVRGMSAHLPGSVDEFLREKHQDTEREEARLAGRWCEEQAA